MSPPNNAITLLKEAQKIIGVSLIASGYMYPGPAATKEQGAIIYLSHALTVARLYTQLIEDDMYDEVFESAKKEGTHQPW